MAKEETKGAGRPPFYKTPEELKKKADEYFELRDAMNKPYTITGLTLHLGFESRQSFYRYEKDAKFSYTIKSLRTKVENSYEENLHGNNVTGSIFALKNMGWTDKMDLTTDGDKIQMPTQVVYKTHEQTVHPESETGSGD